MHAFERLHSPENDITPIGLIVTGACTFAAGYYTRHVNRIPEGN